MIYLEQNNEKYNNDLRSMIMAFFSGVKITTKFDENEEYDFKVKVSYSDEETKLSLEAKKPEHFYKEVVVSGDYTDKLSFRNDFKLGTYELIKSYAGVSLPWGDLTGVRPTKIAMAKLVAGATYDEAVNNYLDVYSTSKEKAELAVKVALAEKKIIESIDKRNDYCLYIGIPFCPSRCLYCSFTSYPIGIYQDKTDTYIDLVKEELRYIQNAYKGKKLVSIYIGGGTPTSITHELLDELLGEVEELFDFTYLKEFTVEAGRPDSITREKLEVIKKHNVTRISINPQTMNDETLRVIGRAHDSKQTIESFELAREIGFDNINMDLIAGLPGETTSHMQKTLAIISDLKPESITVHSLAIKRAANLKEQLSEYEGLISQDTDEMLDMVAKASKDLGLEPYYLYRQKNIAGNLENVGYAKDGCECLYNILIMEEITDIIAAGAGGSTKLVLHDEKKVERIENCKSVDDYLNRFDEMIDRKKKFNKGGTSNDN